MILSPLNTKFMLQQKKILMINEKEIEAEKLEQKKERERR